MTDPQVQAQLDAEQARLVREALALRRDHPAPEDAPPVVRFLPGRPRPTAAEFLESPAGGWRAAVGGPLPAPGRLTVRR